MILGINPSRLKKLNSVCVLQTNTPACGLSSFPKSLEFIIFRKNPQNLCGLSLPVNRPLVKDKRTNPLPKFDYTR